MRALLAAILASLIWLAPAAGRAADAPFANWAGVIVAGDDHAHSGAASPVFDNARRDLRAAFEAAGFSDANLKTFSVRDAGAKGPDAPLKSDPDTIYTALRALTAHATDGCLIYFTSHGSPQGVLVGNTVLPPGVLGEIVNDACADRPTVVVVAACFSGVFVPALAGRNRMILTAARPDRASFGCGESDHYTFFDTCMLKTLPEVRDFAALGGSVQTCVAKRERELNARPPSEPQLDIGMDLRPALPLLPFAEARPGGSGPTAP